MSLDKENIGALAVFCAALVNGLNVYVLKIGTAFIPQLPLISVAFLIGGVFLLALNLKSRTKFIFSERKLVLKFIWMGITGIAIPWTMIVYALSFSAISNSFLLQMEVFYSIVLSRIFLKEKISGKQVILSVASFVGVAFVLTEGVMRAIGVADLLFLLAPLSWQLAHVVAKDVLNKVDPKVVVMYRLLVGGFILSIVCTLLGWSLFGFLGTFKGTVIVPYLGFGFAIMSSLFYYGVKRINLSKATSIIITYPLISTILAVVLLGETMSLFKTIGISIVFVSTVILARIKGRTYAN